MCRFGTCLTGTKFAPPRERLKEAKMTAMMRQQTGPADFAGAERRTSHRQRVLKGATLSFNKGYSAFECVVRNLSEGGAKLSLGETFGLPATFRLSISGEATHVAHVVWRKANEIGVRLD
jgi:hypothetical protein